MAARRFDSTVLPPRRQPEMGHEYTLHITMLVWEVTLEPYSVIVLSEPGRKHPLQYTPNQIIVIKSFTFLQFITVQI